MKQAYEEYYEPHISGTCPAFREVELLPKCKDVTEFGHTTHYKLVRRKVFFGLINKTYWVNQNNIKWYDAPTVEYYECHCGG